MAQLLTWRDVANPNFGGAQDSLNSAARLLQGATSGLSDAVGNYGDIQTMRKLAQYQDAQKLQGALADGSFDTSMATAQGLGRVMSRPQHLLENAAAAQNMEVAGQNMENQRQNMAINRQTMEQRALMNPLELQAAQQGLATGAWNLQNRQDDVAQKQADMLDQRSVADDVIKARQAGQLADYGGAQQMLDAAIASNRSPVYKQALLDSLVQSGFKNLTTPASMYKGDATGNVIEGIASGTAVEPFSPGAGKHGTRQGNSYDMTFGAGAYGTGTKPYTQQSMSEVLTNGNAMIEATRGKIKVRNEAGELVPRSDNKGTSASGRYQFTNETLERLAPKVLGENWRNTTYTPEVQDKLGEALFNETKGGNLQTIWQGLPNKTPGFYKDKPWSEVKDLIGRYESPTDKAAPAPTAPVSGAPATPAAAALATAAGRTNIAAAGQNAQAATLYAGMIGGSDFPTRLAAVQKASMAGTKDNSVTAIAAEATGKEGVMADVPSNQVQRALNKVVDTLGVNGAVAYEMLKAAGTDGTKFTPIEGNKWFSKNINENRLDQIIKQFQETPQMLQQIRAGQIIQQDYKSVDNANALVEAAKARVGNLQSAAREGVRGVDPLLRAAERDLAATEAAALQNNQQVGLDNSAKAKANSPAPTPAPETVAPDNKVSAMLDNASKITPQKVARMSSAEAEAIFNNGVLWKQLSGEAQRAVQFRMR